MNQEQSLPAGSSDNQNKVTGTGSVNKVFLLGQIERPPRLLDFADEKQVLYFTVMTSDTVLRGGTGTLHHEFHRVKVLNGTAMQDALKLHLGQLVHIEGKLRTRRYFENDEKKYQLEIIASRVTVLS